MAVVWIWRQCNMLCTCGLHMAQLMPQWSGALWSLASVKSRLVLPFWYWLTQVVLDKGPLNRCACVCVCVRACVRVWNSYDNLVIWCQRYSYCLLCLTFKYFCWILRHLWQYLVWWTTFTWLLLVIVLSCSECNLHCTDVLIVTAGRCVSFGGSSKKQSYWLNLQFSMLGKLMHNNTTALLYTDNRQWAFYSFHSSFTVVLFCLQCYDAVGWAAGRASGL